VRASGWSGLGAFRMTPSVVWLVIHHLIIIQQINHHYLSTGDGAWLCVQGGDHARQAAAG
jgi:hypothetical protein